MGSNRRLFLTAAFLAVAAAAPAEDLTIVSKVTLRSSENTSKHWITSEWSRSSTRDSTAIVHLADGRVTVIDDRRKEYWELAADDMEDYWYDLTRRLRTSGAGDIWDLRAKPKLEKLTGQQKIAGYDCEHWSLDIGDGALELDFWVAPSLQPPAGYYDGRRILAVTTGPMGVLFEKAFEELKKVKGYPLSMTTIVRTPMSRTEATEEATEVRKGAIPASTFQVPEGYKKVKPPTEEKR